MTTHRMWVTAVVLALFVGVNVVQAQRAVSAPRISPVRVRSTPQRLTIARVSGRSSAAVSPYSRSTISPNSLFAGSGFGLFAPFPGLGFNFGAANQDWAIKAAIDPATQWRLFETQRYSRNLGFGASGFYLLDGGAYYAPVPAEPAEAEPAPQEQGATAGTEAAEAARIEQQPAVAAAAPLEDVGQFVLALRNGSRIEAVAFTRANDRIIYVTADGFRRTLALADFDPDATIRINEERGTPLEISL
ncbi:MAG TPA: hypothetical protein VEJ45_07940 [Candidatus Acidoferrales bacterium]|nr:hypothetical protein [Candidatus Acidoferrales bacterium]